MKTCNKCGEAKPFDEFERQKGTTHGIRGKCKPCRKEYRAKRYQDKKDFHKKRNAEYYQSNKDHLLAKRADYYSKNLDKVIECNLKYKKKRYKSDPAYRMLEVLRCRQRAALNGELKTAPTREALGCSFEYARQHIENKFTEGMTWDNYGLHGWHVDHIIPCASFDLTDPDQQRQCFHYTNLQPLWAEDNLKKSDKMPHEI